MVTQSTIDYLKAEIERIESHPEKKKSLREHLDRLKETVRNAEAARDAREDFHQRVNGTGKGFLERCLNAKEVGDGLPYAAIRRGKHYAP